MPSVYLYIAQLSTAPVYSVVYLNISLAGVYSCKRRRVQWQGRLSRIDWAAQSSTAPAPLAWPSLPGCVKASEATLPEHVLCYTVMFTAIFSAVHLVHNIPYLESHMNSRARP